MDYFSVPQPTAAKQGEMDETLHIMKAAINSIPAYIERCSHFFAVCPPVPHRDIDGQLCDYGTWSNRGWCECSCI